MNRSWRGVRLALFGAVVLAVIFVVSLHARATPRQSSASRQGRAECRQVNSKILAKPVPYCIFLPPSYDAQTTRRFPILYFLHGLGENEQILLNSDGWQIIEEAWAEKSLGEFVIVAPAAAAMAANFRSEAR